MKKLCLSFKPAEADFITWTVKKLTLSLNGKKAGIITQQWRSWHYYLTVKNLTLSLNDEEADFIIRYNMKNLPLIQHNGSQSLFRAVD